MAIMKLAMDPGYKSTALFLSESALSLLDLSDSNSTSSSSASTKSITSRSSADEISSWKSSSAFPLLKGGVLTSATALGMVLVERMKKAGVSITVFDFKE